MASGCDGPTLRRLRSRAKGGGKLLLLEEPARRGKAEAINKIARSCASDLLVLTNSDAEPAPGSIAALLAEMDDGGRVGIVSATPYFDGDGGMESGLLKVMWSAHNASSLLHSALGTANHSTDELMVIRRGALSELPEGTVNDGAYMGGRAVQKGYLVRTSATARVRIAVPGRLHQVVGQRRRVLFGHIQAWKALGARPRTVESLLTASPATALRIMVWTLAASPELIPVLPVALVTEGAALLLALRDTLVSTPSHAVWKRYAA